MRLRTVQVETGQSVISTGLYHYVRHPMYTAGLLLLGVTPLALGSLWGLLMIVPILGGLVWRLLDEERYLTLNLPGYADYCRQVALSPRSRHLVSGRYDFSRFSAFSAFRNSLSALPSTFG